MIEQTTDAPESPRKWSLFSKSTLRAVLIVGVTYVMTALAIGWQLQGPFAAEETKRNGFLPSIGIAAIALLFTFTHCFLVGSFGLILFRGIGESLKRSNLKEFMGGALVIGFLMIWFGGWFGMPIFVLASSTGWLSLAWFCVHLALTPPGSRMIAYIEHGSTSLALMLTFFVFSIGNWVGVVITLAGQVVLLSGLDQLAHSGRATDVADKLKPESLGINFNASWRTIADFTVRGVFIVAAVALVFKHQAWRKSMAEYHATKEIHEASRVKLEAIGGKIHGERNSIDGYTASLNKPSASDQDLAVLAEFSKIHQLKLVGAPITDEGLKQLKNINSIAKLDLSKTRVSPDGISHLQNVAITDELNLSNTAITDDSLRKMNVSAVKRVDLSGTMISGPGLVVFENCEKLERLNLSSTAVFDDGLKYVEQAARSSRHVQLDLSGTNTSLTALWRLHELPNVKVARLPSQKVASTGSNEPPADDDSPFIFLNLGIDEATAINDKHQVVGWYAGEKRNGVALRRAVILLPHDADSDGRPDTYLRDENQDGINDQMIELGSFPGWDGSAYVTDINNRGQIVGYIQPSMPRRSYNIPQRGFIITPLDQDGDGELDTWFELGNDGKSNRLMKDLGTLGDKKCAPYSINNNGQVVGWSSTRGFVLSPRDINNDGRLNWYKPVEGGPKNELMIDIAGSHNQPAAVPSAINDRGVIVGDIRVFSRNGNTRQTFVLSPKKVGEGGQLSWFVDADGDQINDLITPLTDANSTSVNGVQMVRQGEAYNADLSQIVTWIRNSKNGPITARLWQLDKAGAVISNRELKLPKSAETTAPLHLSIEGDIIYPSFLVRVSDNKVVWFKKSNSTFGYVKGINSKNSIIGKIMIDRLRAHVAIFRSAREDSAEAN